MFRRRIHPENDNNCLICLKHTNTINKYDCECNFNIHSKCYKDTVKKYGDKCIICKKQNINFIDIKNLYENDKIKIYLKIRNINGYYKISLHKHYKRTNFTRKIYYKKYIINQNNNQNNYIDKFFDDYYNYVNNNRQRLKFVIIFSLPICFALLLIAI